MPKYLMAGRTPRDDDFEIRQNSVSILRVKIWQMTTEGCTLALKVRLGAGKGGVEIIVDTAYRSDRKV